MGIFQIIFIIIFVMFYFHNSDQLMITPLSSSSSFAPNHHTHTRTHHLCHPLQSKALLQFKSNFAINSDASPYCEVSHPKTETWKEGTDCCFSWEGVTCDAVTGHVIGIDLSCSWLIEGTNLHSNNSLFSSHIAPNLQMLNLAFNDFERNNMSSLVFGLAGFASSSLTHLNLSWSGLSGNIPPEIFQLSNLVSLDLSWNFIGGLRVDSESVLKGIAQNLTHLRLLNLNDADMSSIVLTSSSLMNLSSSLISLGLRFCDLQGKFPYSSLLLPNLQELYLSLNNFDPITSLPKLNTTKLRVLDLSDINFSSSIGFLDLVANLLSLRTLRLSNCSLSGSIPSSFGNLTKITVLFLPTNHLSGSIPSSFSNLTKITRLYLFTNHLSGPIPNIFSDMTQLTYLILSENQLEGPLPSWLFALPSLEYVDLSENNNLSSNTNLISYTPQPNLTHLILSSCNLSEFPSFVRATTNLIDLDISSNKIRGEIPRWVFNLRKLRFINLSQNLLQGPLFNGDLSSQICDLTSLEVLDLSFNHFHGLISPICDLTSLKVLDLSFNHFHGLISPCLGSFAENISVLNLQMNDLQGFIPNTFTSCKKLAYLNLKANQLRGTLPQSLLNCESLKVLDISNNMVEGTFPYWLGTLSYLQVLILGSNKFYGFINHLEYNFANGLKESFPRLRILDLSTNNFSGPLPTTLFANLKGMMNLSDGEGLDLQYLETIGGGRLYSFSVMITMKGFVRQLEKILDIFTAIDLSSNTFEGEIPQVVGKLSLLRGLNLSHNSLNACIPPSIGDLINVEWLDLSNNKLNGQIPQQLVNVNSLAVFNVSNNHLHGPIPQGRQFSTFGDDSYKGNFGLCGFPLSKCGSGQENQPPPQTEDDSNSAIELDWKIVFLGYGCGTIFGLSMGYVVFTTGSPKWVVKIVEGKRHKSVKKTKKKAKVTGGTRN